MPTSRLSPRTILFVAIWLTASVYAWTYLDRGWVPHDEGTLALSAERVLSGMLPHVDYDEVYTGGLAIAGAAAFRVLGVDLFTLRLLLFAAFVVWIPVVYWSARRFATPPLAGLVTLLAAAWSIPGYSAAMPSWFNLFFASFALACLLRYLEDPKRRWLVVAGVSAGLSILIKIVGLYLVAGCLLALAFFGQSRVTNRPAEEASGTRVFSVLITVSAGVLVALVWTVVGRTPGKEVLVHFLLPVAAVCGWLVIREWRLPPSTTLTRLRDTTSLFLPFILGVALPVLAFLAPYAWQGGLDDLYRGLFVDPALRFEFATRRPPHLRTMVTVLPFLFLMGVSWSQPQKSRLRIAGLLSALGGLFL
ncbi:MAG: glycosyltransferase family 39 protein, partial [Gemmatimonadetes bacterium]|nr:glycosyltransferase family 39 protein [Gemmatimonadota bacterium]